MAEEIGEDYALSLQDLSYNSKPIITSLTLIAEENEWAAEQIVQVIEQRLQSVPLNQKLPVMYLMDSIIKNVKGKYLVYFAANLYRIYTAIYEQACASQKEGDDLRARLEKLIKTWSGYFADDLLYGLRQFIADKKLQLISGTNTASGQAQAQSSQLQQQQSGTFTQQPMYNKQAQFQQPYYGMPMQSYGVQLSPEQMQLQQSILQLLQQKQADLSRSGYDLVLQNQLQTLQQLSTLVSQQQLPQNQIAQIALQIASLWSTGASGSTPVSSSIPPISSSLLSSLSQLQHAKYVNKYSLLSFSYNNNNNSHSTSSIRSIPQQTNGSGNFGQSAEGNKADDASGEQSVEAQVYALYDALPLQCKQCGQRFQETEDGKQKLTLHLDGHFRMNKKASFGSRDWFLSVDVWVKTRTIETTSGDNPFFENESAGVGVSQNQVGDSVSKQSNVMIPYLPELGKQCNICFETFKVVWDEGYEDWMLVDAVRKDQKNYHIKCLELQDTSQSGQKTIGNEESTTVVTRKRKNVVVEDDTKPQKKAAS
ncbi:hypothetical protein MP228_000983 [Amoeboaphelidium protococcarum]|nr:hypothetical protein MP228_000983 [Amoeboaphelidium protococcarum]